MSSFMNYLSPARAFAGIKRLWTPRPMDAEKEFDRRYRDDTPLIAETRPPLRPDVLVTPTLAVGSEEEYSSADEDDPAWHREEERRGTLFAEDVLLTSTPRPRRMDFVHDVKVTDVRPSGGKSTPMPRVAGPDPVTEGPMYEMLREMKHWRESQDRLSQTLLAKLSNSAGRDPATSQGNSEENNPRHAERSTEASPERRNIENSADRRVREESTLAWKSPPLRRKGKNSPSVSVSSETTRQPGGGRGKPSPEEEVEGSCCHVCAGDLPKE
jgi:hypothetical protein